MALQYLGAPSRNLAGMLTGPGAGVADGLGVQMKQDTPATATAAVISTQSVPVQIGGAFGVAFGSASGFTVSGAGVITYTATPNRRTIVIASCLINPATHKPIRQIANSLRLAIFTSGES